MMIEQDKSIWHSDFDSYWRVIPINTVVKVDGSLVMGAGLAKQAAERYLELPNRAGASYSGEFKNNIDLTLCVDLKLVLFPTKIHWREKSKTGLIINNLCLLKTFLEKGYQGLNKVVCPQLGCGLGGLNWERDVKPLVEKYFGDDDNFVVVYQ